MGAYQAKLEERKLQEEEERRKEQMEAVLDVTKQRDLGGFYRHLYKQTFADKSEKEDKVVEVEKKEVSTSFQKKDAAEPDVKSRRQYRQRREDSPEPETSVEESVKTEPVDDTENIEEHPKESKTERRKTNLLKKLEKRAAASASLVSAAAIDRAAAADRADKAIALKKVDPDSSSDESEKSSSSPVKQVEIPVVPKVKIDIWKKRTTGALFEEALQRYQLRKGAREQALVRWP